MPRSAMNEVSRGVFQLGHGPNSILFTIEDNVLTISRQPAAILKEGEKAKELVLKVDGSIANVPTGGDNPSIPGDPSTSPRPIEFLTTKDLEELFK